jgi:hypothetical protein
MLRASIERQEMWERQTLERLMAKYDVKEIEN